ncbi:MAG: cytochrome bd ubiquinol oxidase subunit [Pseudonocardiales bacterium]|jgi:cytochrome d ubiquinol oxidase subunit II|nr:cytochrome bd ubiquinol oxidase subunit [Pseudonocardiales bacterium]
MTTLVASVLLTGIVAYGVFGGADFGTGLWDLTAGGAQRGARPRALIDHAIGPVWEANHTWLIFCLVLLWTGFPTAFAAIMTTQYIPLGIAALGIVLRGSGFAFRKVSMHTAEQRLNGVAFAASSVITPFCFGAVVGGIASDRVPAAGHGDPLASWLNPTSIVGGVLAVLTCGYLAAIFLTAEAFRAGQPDLERWFRRRAMVAAVAAGITALSGLFVLDHDAHRLYVRLLHVGWPFIAMSVIAGTAALLATVRGRARLLRPLGVLAVAAVLVGWGAAQYPYLLGSQLSLTDAASPPATMTALGVVTVAAAALVGPSLVALFVLTNRGRLTG